DEIEIFAKLETRADLLLARARINRADIDVEPTHERFVVTGRWFALENFVIERLKREHGCASGEHVAAAGQFLLRRTGGEQRDDVFLRQRRLARKLRLRLRGGTKNINANVVVAHV